MAIDLASVFAAGSAIRALPNVVERIFQVTQNVKLVKQDRRLRCMCSSGIAKQFLHIYYR